MAGAFTHLSTGTAILNHYANSDVGKFLSQHRDAYLSGILFPDHGYAKDTLDKVPLVHSEHIVRNAGEMAHWSPFLVAGLVTAGTLPNQAARDEFMAFLLGALTHDILDLYWHQDFYADWTADFRMKNLPLPLSQGINVAIVGGDDDMATDVIHSNGRPVPAFNCVVPSSVPDVYRWMAQNGATQMRNNSQDYEGIGGISQAGIDEGMNGILLYLGLLATTRWVLSRKWGEPLQSNARDLRQNMIDAAIAKLEPLMVERLDFFWRLGQSQGADGFMLGNSQYTGLQALWGSLVAGLTRCALFYPDRSPLANGEYRLVAKVSGKALDVKGGATTDHAPLQQWSWNGTDSQIWKIEYVRSGSFRLTAKVSGKVLGVTGTQEGATAEQSAWRNASTQLWDLTRVDGEHFTVRAGDGNLVLDVKDGSTADGDPIQQWHSNETDSQLWKIQVVQQNLGGLAASAPTVYQGSVYFQSTSGELWAVLSDLGPGGQIGSNTTASPPFVTDDGWLYFRGDDNKLWKMRTDGSQQTQIGHNTTVSTPFVTADGWVYFRGDDNKLWKVRTDGSQQAQIGRNTTVSTPFVTDDGWVYFQGDDNKLWKVRTDGTGQQQVRGNTTASSPFVAGDWVYFRGDDNKLWKVRTDGSQQTQIGRNTTVSTPFVTADGWVYFQGDDNKLWKVRADGTGQQQIRGNTTVSSPVVAGDWVYFRGTDNKLWRVIP